MRKSILAVLILLLAAMVVKPTDVSAASVTIYLTNITNRQALSNTIYAVGPCGTSANLFIDGLIASLNMEKMAEAGFRAPHVLFLRSKGWNVVQGIVPVLSGNTQSYTIPVPVLSAGKQLCMSTISWLVPSNDAVAAVQNIPVAGNSGFWFYLRAYDAGTECNSELCADMLAGGRACLANGQGFNPLRCPREHIVTFHAGINGKGSLSKVEFDFNPLTPARLFFRYNP